MAKEKDTIAVEEPPALAGLTFDQLQEVLALGATLDHINQLAGSGFGFAQIKALAPSLAPKAAGGAGISADQLKELLEGQRKAMRPENEAAPLVSVFNPKGERDFPKARLKRPTFFNGGREREDVLTPTELELYNRFDRTMTARDGKWKAEIRQNGSAQELYITTVEIGSLDGRLSLPALSLILRELLDGAEAADPGKMADRIAALEAQIKALGSKAA